MGRTLLYWLPLGTGAGALLVTAAAAPTRTVAGLFFLALLVPALQLLAWTFLGRGAAIATGMAAGLLTLWQVAGPPRPATMEPVQWPAAFTAPNQQMRAILRPPRQPQAQHLLQQGGRAALFLCREKGGFEDLDIQFMGRQLEVVKQPTSYNCWLELAVPVALFPRPEDRVEVLVRPKGPTLPSEADRTVLVGGYTRPPERGGQSGGAAFFDGSRWREDDLSPVAEVQAGRYFFELRVTDATGRVREIWY